MTNKEALQRLMEPFPACELEFRTQPFSAVYVDARSMVKRLNEVFPGDWSFGLSDSVRVDENGNVARDGTLTLYWPEADGPRYYTSTGSETKDIGKGEPKAEKGADSDTFKRCCYRIGIAACNYEYPKDIRNNTLTKEQVVQAARMAGYEGEILPHHYGPMEKGRITETPVPLLTNEQKALGEAIKEKFGHRSTARMRWIKRFLKVPPHQLQPDEIPGLMKALGMLTPEQIDMLERGED